MASPQRVATNCLQGGCLRNTLSADGYCQDHDGTTAPRSTVSLPSIRPSTDVAPALRTAGRVAAKQPRDYQLETTAEVLSELGVSDRCLVRAACGMGKTVIAQQIIRDHYAADPDGNGVYVVVTAGIQLTKQCREAFDRDGVVGPHHPFSVHDDSDDLEAARSDGGSNREDDIETLTAFLSTPADHPRVVFVTYNSVDKLIEAQRRLGGEADADLVVLDESHRLGGTYSHDPAAAKRKAAKRDVDDDAPLTVSGRIPRVFHNDVDDSLQARSRVFLSATPKAPDESEQYAAKATRIDGLRAVAELEDAGKKVSTTISHTDRAAFGRIVASYGLTDAVRRGALVPIEPVMAPVRVRGSVSALTTVDGAPSTRVSLAGDADPNGALSLASYTTLASTLESLASGDGRSALAFAGRIKDAEDVATNFAAVARHLAARDIAPMTPTEASARLESGAVGTEARAARLTLLAEHGSAVSASSESNKTERDRAFTHFDNPSCGCPRAGGWCACARVVSNVDLFGQGIDISSIDTVVLGDVAKTGDIQLTQAVGRAMRLHPGKTKGRVVIPSVTLDDNGRTERLAGHLTTKALYGVSRLMRDSIGRAVEQKQMEPSSGITVEMLGEGRPVPLEDAVRTVQPRMLAAAALAGSYASAELETKKLHEQITGSKTEWNGLSPEERHANVLQYVAAFRNNSPELEVIAAARPTRLAVTDAERAVELLRTKARSYDRGGLTEEETKVAKAIGVLDASGVPRRAAGSLRLKSLIDRCGARPLREAVASLSS